MKSKFSSENSREVPELAARMFAEFREDVENIARGRNLRAGIHGNELRKLRQSQAVNTEAFRGFASGNLRRVRAKLGEARIRGEDSRAPAARRPVVLPANCIKIYCTLLIHTCRRIHTRKC